VENHDPEIVGLDSESGLTMGDFFVLYKKSDSVEEGLV